jgi:hypothetical protein
LGVEKCERVSAEEKALEKGSTQSRLGSHRISDDRTKLFWITNENESLDTAHKGNVRFRFKCWSGFVHKTGIELSALKRGISRTRAGTADDRY